MINVFFSLALAIFLGYICNWTTYQMEIFGVLLCIFGELRDISDAIDYWKK